MRSLGELLRLPDAVAHAEITAHLDAGGDLRARDYTLLHWACVRGRLDLLERLIGLGLTANDARAVRNYALRGACQFGHLAVVNRLIELGLNAVDARAQNNFALRYACFYGHLAVIERLIELGLDAADARVDDNYTLRVACFYGHHAVVARLLELGVEPTPAALRSLTAYACAEDDERADRLRRAVERWRDTSELAAAEAALTPPEQDEWEKVKPQWSSLRYAD